jgi:hypothetical protein
LLVEVAVHHRVDAEKLNRVRELNLPAIELTLRAEHARMRWSELEEVILNRTEGKRWLFHPRELECEQRFEQFYRSEQERLKRTRADALRVRNKRVSASQGNNPMSEFRARYGRYPSVEETPQVFIEMQAGHKRK